MKAPFPVLFGALLCASVAQSAHRSILLDGTGDSSRLTFDLSRVPLNSVIYSAILQVGVEGICYDWAGLGSNRYIDYEVPPFSFRSRLIAGKVDVLPLLKILVATRRKEMNLLIQPAASLIHPRLEITFDPTAPRAVVNHPPLDDKFGPVTLDAGNSAKADGSKTGLAYRWTVEVPAPGSSNSPGQEIGREVKVKFEPDVPGQWTVRLRVTDPATKEYSEETLVFADVQRAPHPRLGLNDSILNPVKVLQTTKKPQWERFQTWLNSPRDPVYGSKGQALLYGYVVTKNHGYLDQAWSFYQERLYLNGKPRTFFGECGKAVYCKDGDAAGAGGILTWEIALLYDWGFDGLNGPQRVDLIEWLNNAAEYNHQRNPYLHAHFTDEGSAILLGLGAVAYATQGENRSATRQMAWFRDEWAHTRPVMNAAGSEVTATALINLANLVYYASSENLFLADSWFQTRLGQESLRGNGLALARRFQGTEEADIWNWKFRQPGADEGPDPWTDLFFYSQPPALRKPARLLIPLDVKGPVLSNLKPAATLPAGNSRTMLSVTTSGPSQCRFSVKPGTTFPYMTGNLATTDGLTHAVQSGALDGGDTYSYYIRCQDKAGNENSGDTVLRFSVDRNN